MSEFVVRKATRQGVNPLIGLYGVSGSGKTYSALLLGRGFVGPKGRMVVIDTEGGRGSMYADEIPGGYDTIQMTEPFSPRAYIDAMRVALKSGAECLIIDSASHEWEAIGGVQDMAMSIAKRRAEKYNREYDGVIQFGDWKEPKMEHAKMMIALLQSTVPVIVCLRAKFKSHQVTGTAEMAKQGIIQQKDVGRSLVVKDEFSSPIHDESFIYEMTVHAEIEQEHTLRVTKCHIGLADIFKDGAIITTETGARLAEWCKGGKTAGFERASAPAPTADVKALKARLWALTESIHMGDKVKGAARLQQHLFDEGLLNLDPPETLAGIGAERLAEIIAKIGGKP